MLVASIQMGVVEGDKSRAIDEAAEKVLEAADQVYCLRDGSIVAEGPAQDFLDRATLEKLYFGEA